MLPTTIAAPKTTPREYAFKTYVIVSMTLIWTSYTLLLRHTRTSAAHKSDLYFSTTVVLLAETTKFCLSTLCLWKSCDFSFRKTRDSVVTDLLNKPKELLKMSVPSVVYAIQNNLDFIALSNLEPGVYQVTTQLKVVTTAIFMVVMLGRHYSPTRWFSIVLLFAGVALVQLQAVNDSKDPKLSGDQNYWLGLTAVLVTCVTAGFAGVYFERMLKDGTQTPFWIRNLQMYMCGIVSAGFACLASERENIMLKGFFHGYDLKVFIIVGLLSAGGIYISLVMKYLDNLLKSFASAISIILIFVASVYLFGSTIGLYFVVGTLVVCGSILLYNSVPE